MRTNAMAPLTIKSFENCKPTELVRFADEKGKTHWALIGDRSGNERLMLLVLPVAGVPYTENIMGHMNILRRPYENAVVLSYGSDYSFEIEHDSACEVGGEGTLVIKPGAYVLMANAALICCRWDAVPGKIAYYTIKTGQVTQAERGFQRAVFACWKLIWKGDNQVPVTLLRVCANTSPTVAPIIASTPGGESRFKNR
jgi:hypothetical protein